MKLLNDFVNKILAIKYIYNSEEFQKFIKVKDDFSKIASDIKEKSFIDIADEFKINFSECLYTHSAVDQEQIIQETLNTFNSALELFNSFEKSCKTSVENFHSFEIEMNNLMSGVNEITDFYSETYGLGKIEFPKRECIFNPYAVLLD